jgi:hypothetical protein
MEPIVTPTYIIKDKSGGLRAVALDCLCGDFDILRSIFLSPIDVRTFTKFSSAASAVNFYILSRSALISTFF